MPEFQIKNDQLSFLTVRREGNSTLNSDEELQENMIFDGATNAMVFQCYYDLNLRCKYEFYDYPFDHQKCEILVSMATLVYVVHIAIFPYKTQASS